MEVEAKLLARSPSVLDAIAKRKRLGPYRLAPLSDEQLETLYLDTPRRDLLRHGIALRIRRVGEACELTLKLPGKIAGAVHSRPESTVPLRGMPAFPFRPSGTGLARQVRRWTKGTALAPFLVTRIHRRALAVRRGEGAAPAAELDLDRVELALPGGGEGSGQGRGSFFEVEIELRRGTEKDLARIVAVLRKRYALRTSKKSKLERGLRWAGIAIRSR
jgi:triphosphatase